MELKPKFTLFFMFIAICSCHKPDCHNCTGDNTREHTVFFSGTLAETKSGNIQKFHEGNYFRIYGYIQKENPATRPPWPGTPFDAASDGYGNLKQLTAKNLIVPKGTYDFYAVSAGFEYQKLPSFSNGVATSLENNIDYMWAQHTGTKIEKDAVVLLQFKHKCSNIVISVTNNNNHHSINKISVTLPDNHVTMALHNGTITPSKSLSPEYTELSLDSNSAETIILPLQPGFDPFVKVETTHIESNKKEVRKATLPASKEGFQEGKRYLYTLEISGMELITGMASVQDWHLQEIEVINIK